MRRRCLRDVDRRRRGGRGVIGRVGGRKGDRERLVVAGAQNGARGRRVGECPRHAPTHTAHRPGRGGVQLRSAQRRAVDDVGRIGPTDGRRRLRDVDRRRRGGRGVIGRVGGRKGDRERLVVAGAQNGARGRGVGECPRHAPTHSAYRPGRGGVQLRSAQRRAVDDVRRIGPTDGRRRLRDVDRRRRGGRGVIGRVGGRKGDRERLVVAGAENGARGRGVSERPRHAPTHTAHCPGRGGVQLRSAQRGAVDDVRRIGPTDGRRRLRDVDRRRCGGRGVIGRVGGRKGDRERLVVAGAENGARGRGVSERPRHAPTHTAHCPGRGGVQLRSAQRGAVDDVRRIGPTDRRRRLRDVDRRRRGGRGVIGRVGGRKGDRERLVVAGAQTRCPPPACK